MILAEYLDTLPDEERRSFLDDLTARHGDMLRLARPGRPVEIAVWPGLDNLAYPEEGEIPAAPPPLVSVTLTWRDLVRENGRNMSLADMFRVRPGLVRRMSRELDERLSAEQLATGESVEVVLDVGPAPDPDSSPQFRAFDITLADLERQVADLGERCGERRSFGTLQVHGDPLDGYVAAWAQAQLMSVDFAGIERRAAAWLAEPHARVPQRTFEPPPEYHEAPSRSDDPGQAGYVPSWAAPFEEDS